MKYILIFVISTYLSFADFLGISKSKGDIYFDAGIGGGYTILTGQLNANYNSSYPLNLNFQGIINERHGLELELGFQSWSSVAQNSQQQKFIDNYHARLNYKHFWDNEGAYKNFIGSGLSYNNLAFISGVPSNSGIDALFRNVFVENNLGIHLFFGVSTFFSDYLGVDAIVGFNRLFTENSISYLSFEFKAKYYFD